MMSGSESPPAGVGEPGKAQAVQAMFGRIVGHYDLLNDLMTLGLHRRWRRQAIAAAWPARARALDLGAGTGDLALALECAGASQVVAVDFVPGMIQAARRKASQRGQRGIHWLVGDALALPFADRSFDCVVSGFVVRNVADTAGALAEMYRVLRPGGRMVCLETTPPRHWLGRAGLALFGRLAPVLGRIIAGDPAAYRYLPASAARFWSADELATLMRQAGFATAVYRRYGGGLVAIHLGVRPPA